MTKLKQTITLDDSCALTITDTSGFYDAGTNPFGFLPETNSDALALNIYKLSHGYFLNVLLYNRYANTPLISNPSDTSYIIASEDVDNNTYANNFIPSVYSLGKDGSYTINRYFIPSLEFYTANHTNSIYDGKDMFYMDNEIIYKIIDSTATPITVTAFINSPFSNSDVIYVSTTFISTCLTNACYFKVLSTILDINIGACEMTNKLNELVQLRDLIYMTLEVIKYLKDQNNITQVQKLIDALDICGGICATALYPRTFSNCGCNG